MRIIVFINSLYTGGAEFSTLTFYGWLLKRGHDVRLVCSKQANPSYDPQQFGFDRVHYLDGHNFPTRLRALNRFIREVQPELVHSVLFDANLLARVSRMRLRSFVHLESLVNEMYSPFRLADPHVTRMKLEGYRLVDGITQHWGVDHFHANGQSVAKHYHDKLNIAAHRMTIIPRGRQSNPFIGDALNRESVRKQLRTGNRVMLINVARQEFQKGIEVLVESLNKLGGEKEKIQLVLAGREGNRTSLIREKIREGNLEHQVVMVGHRQDIPSLLAAADVFVFPSRFEGLPGALIEAEAAGLPIVCSDIPNNGEVVIENRNALFFPVDDVDTLAHHLQQLVTQADRRITFGSESSRIFKESFDITLIHERMETLLKDLLTKS